MTETRRRSKLNGETNRRRPKPPPRRHVLTSLSSISTITSRLHLLIVPSSTVTVAGGGLEVVPDENTA
jgi:hypothetical protein